MIEQDDRVPIPAWPSEAPRPRWSVMIPTYDCAHYLPQALASVLAQDPGPSAMQIEVVDDASAGSEAEKIVAELGGGRVAYHRQPRNVGHVRNFDSCLLRARGHLVHLLHGDDRVRSGFYRTMEEAFGARPQIGAAFCRHHYIDENGEVFGTSRVERQEPGILEDWLETIATWQRIQAPSIVVRRAVYERLGGFDRRITVVGEDWEMWVRIAASYPVWYSPEPLAEYRKHALSLTARSLRSGQNLRDLRQVIEINRSRLPHAVSSRVVRRARRQCALWGLDLAGRLINAGEWPAAAAQVTGALRCSRSTRVLVRVVRLMFRAAAVASRRSLASIPGRPPGPAPRGGTI
jgi:GT2 family glycosyltransferase